jgi:hypothetical protein
MKNKDLTIFIILILISTIIGYFFWDNEFHGYSDIVTLLSIIIGFEITSLSIIFNTPLKKTLYDRKIKNYKTELHRLRDFYRFSIYVSLISVVLVILVPDFSFRICDSVTLKKSIVVLPIMCSSIYCFVRLCNDLFQIFVYPTNK